MMHEEFSFSNNVFDTQWSNAPTS